MIPSRFTLIIVLVLIGGVGAFISLRAPDTHTLTNTPNTNHTLDTNTKMSSGSPDAWWPSPFSTGSQLTAPGYTPPNTVWPTRTITLTDGRRVTYIFGEGNPKEVAPSREELRSRCDSVSGDARLYQKGFCDPESAQPRIITKDLELALKRVLEDPGWESLILSCQKALEESEPRTPLIQNPIPTDQVNFQQIRSSGFLDLTGFLTVDLDTGWKRLDVQKIDAIITYLEKARLNGGPGNAAGWINPEGDCVDRMGSGVLSDLQNVKWLYTKGE